MDMSVSEFQEMVMDSEALHADSWGRKESDMTERLNWTGLKLIGSQTMKFNSAVELNKPHTPEYWKSNIEKNKQWIKK